MADSLQASSQMAQLRQQELKAWQPVLTPVAVIGLLLIVAITFMPIGVVLLDASENIVEITKRYDNIDNCSVTENDDYTNLPKACDINFTITKQMKPPIYFYYELRGFYQNHRLYMSSKSDEQLRGIKDPNMADCSADKTHNKKTLYACGLVAGSFFEDRFRMKINDNDLCNTTTNCVNYGKNNSAGWKDHWDEWDEEPNWSMRDIAWESDINDKFKTYNYSSITRSGYRQDLSGLQLPDVTNEDFIVWMRAAALPNFRKLHRKINDLTLNIGDEVTVTIMNWFPVNGFNGEKWFVLTTTEWTGGTNYLLAWTYIIVSIVFIILAVIFAIFLLFGKRKLADVDAFEWHNRPNTTTVATISS